jgi:hypothetical protein
MKTYYDPDPDPSSEKSDRIQIDMKIFRTPMLRIRICKGLHHCAGSGTAASLVEIDLDSEPTFTVGYVNLYNLLLGFSYKYTGLYISVRNPFPPPPPSLSQIIVLPSCDTATYAVRPIFPTLTFWS